MTAALRTQVGNTTPAHPLAINPGASANDVILGAFITDSATGTTFTYPSGFSQSANALCNSTDGGSLAVAIKNASTGSEGSISTSNAASQQMIGAFISFSGIDNTTPLDVTPPAAVINTTQTAAPLVIDSNSITPITNGAVIVAFRLTDVSASESKPCTFTTQSGTTGSWTSYDYNSGFYNLSIGWAIQTTAGAVTVRSSTSGAANAAGALFVVALRPSGGPVLTNPTGTATGATTAQGTVDTDTANGTLYGVVTSSATKPTATQVENGQDHNGSAATWGGSQAVSSTGTKTLNASGLSTGVAQYFHFMHKSGGGTQSSVVSSSAFTPSGSAALASVSGDNVVLLGETGIQAAGQFFGDTTGTLAIIAGGVTQAQTPTAWRSATAVFSFTQGNLPYGSATFQLTTN